MGVVFALSTPNRLHIASFATQAFSLTCQQMKPGLICQKLVVNIDKTDCIKRSHQTFALAPFNFLTLSKAIKWNENFTNNRKLSLCSRHFDSFDTQNRDKMRYWIEGTAIVICMDIAFLARKTLFANGLETEAFHFSFGAASTLPLSVGEKSSSFSLPNSLEFKICQMQSAGKF